MVNILGTKKSQEISIHVVIVIAIALIITVVVALYAMGVFGEGFEISSRIFNIGEGVSENATEIVDEELGGL